MKRSLVRLVVGLIALNAALAIFVLLSGEIGDTEGRILGTSLIATGTAVLAMICAPALTAGRLRPVPHIGIGAGAIGFGLAVASIWGELDAAGVGKSVGTAYVVSGFSALACLLSAWPVPGRARWLGPATNLLIAAVAAAILAAMWFEIDVPGYWRGFSVLAVLLAAASLAKPVLHRAAASPRSEPISHCPFCGSDLEGFPGETIACPSCGRRFTVRLD